MKLTTSEIRLGRGALAELEASFHGRIIQPGDLDFHEYRAVWNGSIDRFPALIARCAGVADVIAAVSFAREAGLAIAVRGGGHGFPGLSICDGGIVIDLGPMKGIRVDPAARTVRAQAGVKGTETLDRARDQVLLRVRSTCSTSAATMGGSDRPPGGDTCFLNIVGGE